MPLIRLAVFIKSREGLIGVVVVTAATLVKVNRVEKPGHLLGRAYAFFNPHFHTILAHLIITVGSARVFSAEVVRNLQSLGYCDPRHLLYRLKLCHLFIIRLELISHFYYSKLQTPFLLTYI